MAINPATGQDYHINPQTGVWDDNYYANVGRFLEQGGGTAGDGGGGTDVNSIIQATINALSPFFPEKIEDYEIKNPFFFDEALAKEASTAEYAPYYGELLSDYIADVEKTKSRSKEDLAMILEQLNAGKEYYTGVERRALEKSIRQTNEGYAGRNLFFSGVRERDIKELQTESEARTGQYLGTYGYGVKRAELGAGRTLADVGTAQKRYTRNIERQKEEAVAGGILQRKRETREEYEISKKKYYSQYYPSIYGGIG